MDRIEYRPLKNPDYQPYMPLCEMLKRINESKVMTLRGVYPEDVIHDSILYAEEFIN